MSRHSGRQIRDSSATGAPMPDVSAFTRQQRDLYIPAGETGFWQGAIRDGADGTAQAIASSELMMPPGSGARQLISLVTVHTIAGDVRTPLSAAIYLSSIRASI